MQSIENNLKRYEIKIKNTSERAEVIKSIFSIYSSKQQKDFRKKENWSRYCKFCRTNKIPHSESNTKKFKREKNFIREHTIESFCFKISHIPTKDLYYILSIAKDDQIREKPFILKVS